MFKLSGWRIGVVLGSAALVGMSLTGCAKITEPFKDAPVSDRNEGPAVVGNMPDGFGNWAFKCNGPDGVYTLFHSDSKYGGIAVVPNDPQCGGNN